LKKELLSIEGRIFYLRKILKESQVEFSRKIGITQGALSQIEGNKSSISVETLERICRNFQVNPDWMLDGSGEMFKQNSIQQAKASSLKLPRLKQVTVLIRNDAHADYLDRIDDEHHLQGLDGYRIPGFENGNYRMFEISGESMVPLLYENEIVITEEITDTVSVREGNIYVIITAKGIVVKKLYFNPETPQYLKFVSENKKFNDYQIPRDEIMQLWEVKAKISAHFLNITTPEMQQLKALEERVRNLEKIIKEERSDK
jgi:transcriptional regulator with XRE-family HTH domain